jgi:hypothetical protein
METKVKRVGEDFRTGTIAYYGPDDKTVKRHLIWDGVLGLQLLIYMKSISL